MYTHEHNLADKKTIPTRPVVMPKHDKTLDALLHEYMQSRQVSARLAKKNGWYPAQLDGPRVVIPCVSRVNTWPYYQARALDDHLVRYRSPSAPRGDALVVVLPSWPEKAVIVEGPMDALAAAGSGYIGIGIMGNKPSEAVLMHIRFVLQTYGVSAIVIPDNDAVPQAVDIAAKLWKKGGMCSVQLLTGYKDLAAMPFEEREAWFRRVAH